MFLFPFDPTQLPPTLALFLAGLAASSGVIASWIFAHVPILAAAPDWFKQILTVLLGMVFTGFLTWFTASASPDTVGKLNAYYLAIVQILVTIFGVGAFHVGYRVVYRGLLLPSADWVQHRLRVPAGTKG